MNDAKIAIRRAGLADVPLLSAQVKEFYRDIRNAVLKENPELKPYMQVSRGRDAVIVRWMQKWIRSRLAIVIIADANSQPVGFMTASIEKGSPIAGPARYGYISFLFVKRRYRGKGISSCMMQEALDWFRKRKVKHVALSFEADNKPTRAIYSKWGFQEFGVFAWKRN